MAGHKYQRKKYPVNEMADEPIKKNEFKAHMENKDRYEEYIRVINDFKENKFNKEARGESQLGFFYVPEQHFNILNGGII